MPRGKYTRRPRTTAGATEPKTIPILGPTFLATIRARLTSGQLVTLFQSVPQMLEFVQVEPQPKQAGQAGQVEVSFPRGTAIGDAIAEKPPVKAAALKAPRERIVTRQRAKPVMPEVPVLLGGYPLTTLQKKKFDSMVKRYGPKVILKRAKNGYPSIDVEATLKSIGKTRDEVADQSWPVGSLEDSIKKAIRNL